MSLLHPLQRRKRAYQVLFASPEMGDGKTVLADLKRFCRYPDAPVVKDANGATDALETGRLIGRQEVFNRIRAMIHLDERTLFNLKEETSDE